ncbi:MAG: hypothetical protein N3B18_09785 [Desulfobacterota bacterium]|nr:hypothetical protein [Thermodesulfobacteriota bacterium]
MRKSSLALVAIILLWPWFSDAVTHQPSPPLKSQTPAGAKLVVRISLDSSPETRHTPGVHVVVCRPEVVQQIQAVRKTGSIIAQQSGAYRALLSDIPFMEGKAAEAAVANMVTDENDRCTFEQLSAGSYVLFATYHDRTEAGYWMLPITLKNGKKTAVTLSRKNLTEYAKDK